MKVPQHNVRTVLRIILLLGIVVVFLWGCGGKYTVSGEAFLTEASGEIAKHKEKEILLLGTAVRDSLIRINESYKELLAPIADRYDSLYVAFSRHCTGWEENMEESSRLFYQAKQTTRRMDATGISYTEEQQRPTAILGEEREQLGEKSDDRLRVGMEHLAEAKRIKPALDSLETAVTNLCKEVESAQDELIKEYTVRKAKTTEEGAFSFSVPEGEYWIFSRYTGAYRAFGGERAFQQQQLSQERKFWFLKVSTSEDQKMELSNHNIEEDFLYYGLPCL